MGRLRRMKDPLLSGMGDKMLRVTANTQLMREIIDLLSVLAEEAKLVWGGEGVAYHRGRRISRGIALRYHW